MMTGAVLIRPPVTDLRKSRTMWKRFFSEQKQNSGLGIQTRGGEVLGETSLDQDRRSVLKAAAATAAFASEPAPASPRHSEIVMMDALALASAIKARKLSCVEVMSAFLDHIDRINPKVNAIVALQDRDGL